MFSAALTFHVMNKFYITTGTAVIGSAVAGTLPFLICVIIIKKDLYFIFSISSYFIYYFFLFLARMLAKLNK